MTRISGGWPLGPGLERWWVFSYSPTSRAAGYTRESAGAGNEVDEEEEWQTYVHNSRTSFAAPFSDRSCTSVPASFKLTTAIKWFLKFIVHYWVKCANDGEYILILCLSCLMTIVLQAGVDAYLYASTCIYVYQLLVLHETVCIFQMSELRMI